MGIEQNIVTLCNECHYAHDSGLFMKRLKPLGFNTQKDVEDYVISYLKSFYPDWSKDKVTYHKWGNNETSPE